MSRLLLADLARRAPLLPGKDVLALFTSTPCKSASTGTRSTVRRSSYEDPGKSLLVRGLNTLAATISTPLAAPVIAATRLRGGNAASARGAASFAAASVRTARATGCTATLVARADSSSCSAAFTGAVRRAGRSSR